ncbi:hypothetical protein ABKN59_008116 [Abortiporus biennis]
MIIDCLKDDKQSLRACSLVSKMWSTRSRRLLYFYSNALHVIADPSHPGNEFERLAELLRSEILAHKNTFLNIRYLHFQSNCDGSSDFEHKRLKPSVLRFILLHIRLPRLKGVKLENLQYTDPLEDRNSVCRSGVPMSLKTLEIVDTSLFDNISSLSRLMGILALFSKIEKLLIHGAKASSEKPATTTTTPRKMKRSTRIQTAAFPPNLRVDRLDLWDDKSRHLLTLASLIRTIRVSLPGSLLKDLRVSCRNKEELVEFGLLVQKAKGHLQNVALQLSGNLSSWSSDPPDYDVLCLSSCTALKSFRLTVRLQPIFTYKLPMINDEQPVNNSKDIDFLYDQVVEVLSYLPHNIHHITLDLDSDNLINNSVISEFFSNKWGKLEMTLLKYKELEELHFRLDWRWRSARFKRRRELEIQAFVNIMLKGLKVKKVRTQIPQLYLGLKYWERFISQSFIDKTEKSTALHKFFIIFKISTIISSPHFPHKMLKIVTKLLLRDYLGPLDAY